MHNIICGGAMVILAVSSIVLYKRVDECAPSQTDGETRESKAGMGLAITALILLGLKALTHTAPALGKFHMPLEWLYHVVLLILAIINVSYLSTVKTETCSSKTINVADVYANKNLVLFVLISSAVVLVLVARKLIHSLGAAWAGRKGGRSASRNPMTPSIM